MSSKSVLEVKNITKVFPGVKALSDFSVCFYEGEVHGLVGENGAGKSTLMNIISGSLKPTSGEIIIDGNPVSFESSRAAQEKGITIVHQELINCPDVTVAENIFMSEINTGKGLFVNYRKLEKKAKELLERFGSSIDPHAKMKNLSVSDQQIIEIIKAISMNCRIVIFDEPTASLTEKETNELFEIIKGLKERLITVIYISHRMEEIFANCDRVTILKDGCFIATENVADTDSRTIVNKMVGRNLEDYYPPKASEIGEVIFEVNDFSYGKFFKDVSFTVRKGEILGLAGLVGSGRSEMMRSVCGVDPKDSGEVILNGKNINISTYQDAVKNGIVYLTEDRKKEGLFLEMSIMRNISVLDIDMVSNKLFFSNKKETDLAKNMSEEMNIKAASVKQKVGMLSGGNQQKVLISKSLAVEPKILILDEPTRGVDVGAKVEIYSIIRKLSEKGIGIIMISSEMPEIIGMCDKVCVVHEGMINGVLSGSEICESGIIRRASGV